MSKVTEIVEGLARPVVEERGCELWDVELVKESGTTYLRVYIDRPGGVSIDDCEAVSRALDPELDAADLIPDSYTFEVSSAGAERQLKRPSDFERFMGSYCAVKLYAPRDGSREHLGYLRRYEDGDVTIDSDGTEKTFKKSEVAGVRLRLEI